MNDDEEVDTERRFKIIFVGESGVGKTNIISRVARDTFNLETTSTIGLEFICYNTIIDDKKVMFQMWDTAGQERFRSLTNSYYRDADAVIIVYDITKKSTFDKLGSWIVTSREMAPDASIFVLGNKSDLEHIRSVDYEDVKGFKNKWDIQHHFNINAIENDKAKNIFDYIANEIYEKKFNYILVTNHEKLKLTKENKKDTCSC